MMGPCCGRPPRFKLLNWVGYAQFFTSLCLGLYMHREGWGSICTHREVRWERDTGAWRACGKDVEGAGRECGES